ncbi:protocadherin [Stieleria varia]|uniref:Uncharacterized protein n=1 Tax=Stieleria varia TaxID=2528005 RepID=A0A5C6B3D3_9BACT|nr:protocadherin [Stieleria varia]TWU06267.1 hypothetical protein Pla52n_19880 [Stieleria varia]
MTRKLFLTSLGIFLTLCVPLNDAWGRGRGGGGGGGGGGGRGGFSGGGGGFGGGAGRSGGGFSSGAARSPSPTGGSMSGRSPNGFGSSAGRSPSAGVPSRGPNGLGGSGQAGGNFGGPGTGRPNQGINPGAGVAGNRPAAGTRPAAGSRPADGMGAIGGQNRSQFAKPSSGQLSSFLGLPSDQGLQHLSSGSRESSLTSPGQLPAGEGKFDVNYGKTEGDRGGQAGGVTVSGPRGNTAGRVVGVGAQGGVAAVDAVQGAGGGTAARGAAVGPGGQVAAARGAVGPAGFGGGGAVVAGPGGVAAGFTRVSPSGRYSAAAAVRTNYNHWGVYGGGWYTNHPGAWFAAGWASSAAWNACTWNNAATYVGYTEVPPVYYDYGNNVTYESNVVYMNGDEVGTAQEYYDQAATLATAGAQADAPADSDWLPLGVFALTKPGETDSSVTLQLAINKEGIIRGNYTNTNTDKTQLVQGSVDKQTQRAVFTVGDDATHLMETGLYNLTKDESPCLLHFGSERTEQWLLVRLQEPQESGN